MTFGTTFRVRVRVGHFSMYPTMNVAPKNKKLDLCIFQHLEQLLGLEWVIFGIPQTKHVTLLGLGFGLSTCRVRVRVKHLRLGLST